MIEKRLAILLISILVMGEGCGQVDKGESAVMIQDYPDFHTLWDYNAPAETRAKFEELLPKAEASEDRSYHLQLLTQIARTYGLEANFDEAHKLLDRVESELTDDLALVRVRYLLERGRSFRSSDKVAESLPLFLESYALANSLNADFYTVDAAHMVAIAEADPEKQHRWNLTAIDIAEKSSDSRARGWLGSLYNNMGWTYHDESKFEQALAVFEKAVEFRKEQGKEKETKIAKWCVGRCLRSLDRINESLAIQQTLYKEELANNNSDGYTPEELGELHLIKGDSVKAAPFFAEAYRKLSSDNWLARNEPKRLERLRQLGSE